MKRLLLSFLLTFSTIISFAQSWQGKPVVRIENDGQSFLYTFSDSSTAYINKCNVSYIVNMPNSVWVQVGYMYDGSTSRIITASYSAITQPDLASAKILSDTLNAWLRDCQTSGGGGDSILQTLSISGDTLSISDGNSVILPVFVEVDSVVITEYTVLNSLNTPPGSPSTGDTYLVDTSPTGAWVGHEKDIAEWNGSSWDFTDGVQGDYLYNTTNALTYIFRSGNWVQTTGIPALNNGNSISSGLKIGTNNNTSITFETNNVNRCRIDSIGRLHIYNLPTSTDTFVTVSNSLGQLGKIGRTSFFAYDSVYFFRTIAQLRAAMTAKTLKKGAKYQATDFTTIYDQPDYEGDGTAKSTVLTKTSAVEHLVFTANSDSTFDNYVSSVEYPTDIIQFDWSFTQTEVMGEPAKGRISYRADAQGNVLDYDYRTILFKRYRNAGIYSSIFDNDSVSAEFPTFGNYDSAIGNVIIGYCAAYNNNILPFDFLLPNNVFRQTAVKNKGDVIYGNTFLGDTNENFFGDGILGFVTYAGFYYNYFGHTASLCTFLGNAENNYFGDNMQNCTFGARCNDNSIWDAMNNFVAGEDFKRNIQYGTWSNSTVGDSFTDGVIYGLTDSITAGDNNFKIDIKSGKSITIGDNNSNISFGGTKYILPLNDFNGVKNVVFGGSISGQFWSNGINTTDHPEFYNNTSKTVILGSNGSVYGRYFNGTSDVTTIIN